MAAECRQYVVRGLVLCVLIHGVAFCIVSLLQYQNISHLEQQEQALSLDLGWMKEEIHVKEGVTALVKDLVKVVLERLGTLGDSSGHQDGVNIRTKRFSIVDLLQDIIHEQEKAIERHCNSNTTKVCAKGKKGYAGPIGLEGPKGPTGVTGVKGDPGVAGVKGQKGDVGLRGHKGDKGEQGIRGDSGIEGIQGAKGTTGHKGIRGPTGPKGHSGSRGDNGIQGQPGDKGPKGLRGDKGLKGPRGESGVQGHKGVKGEPGLQGLSSNMLGFGCECLKRPKIINRDKVVLKVPVGGQVNLTCAAEGNPQPKIEWQDSQNSFINIAHVKTTDFHAYTCTATNAIGADRIVLTLQPIT